MKIGNEIIQIILNVGLALFMIWLIIKFIQDIKNWYIYLILMAFIGIIIICFIDKEDWGKEK